MKKVFSSIAVGVAAMLSIVTFVQAQTAPPQGFTYQAIVRDGAGKIVAPNTKIDLQAIIHDNTNNGPVVYSETHTGIKTNPFSVVNIVIGQGTNDNGTNMPFSSVAWGASSKFLEIKVNFGNGFQALGSVQLMSVPYALYAGSSGNSSNIFTSGTGISIANGVITNTMPDKVVDLQGINGITVTGTYPNFTINGQNKDFKAGEGIDIANGQIINTKPDVPVILKGQSPVKVTGTYPDYTISTPGLKVYNAGRGIGFDLDSIINTKPDVPVKLVGQGSTTITGAYPNFIIKSVGREYAADANKGIQIVGDSIFNTRPDVPVKLNAAGGITITGNYPEFTIFGSAPKIYTPGTGINIIGPNIDEIINTAPDKVVTMTAGTGIQISGGYPNFNIGTNFVAGTGIKLTGNQIINLNPDVPVTIAGQSPIQVTGTYPNFTVKTTDTDADAFNEIQQLSISGSTITLSKAGGNVSLDYFSNLNSTPWKKTASNNLYLDGSIIGNVGIGVGASDAVSKLQVTGGDVYITDATKGIIMKDTNGVCYRTIVNTSGVLVTTALPICP